MWFCEGIAKKHCHKWGSHPFTFSHIQECLLVFVWYKHCLSTVIWCSLHKHVIRVTYSSSKISFTTACKLRDYVIISIVVMSSSVTRYYNGTVCFKNVSKCFNTNIYSYLDWSGGQSYNLYLNIVHFLTPVLIRHLWQLKTAVFLHWCLSLALLLNVNIHL